MNVIEKNRVAAQADKKTGATNSYVKAAVAALVLTAGAAARAEIDVGVVTTKITEAVVAVGVVGLAVLGVIVAIKAFSWVRAAVK